MQTVINVMVGIVAVSVAVVFGLRLWQWVGARAAQLEGPERGEDRERIKKFVAIATRSLGLSLIVFVMLYVIGVLSGLNFRDTLVGLKWWILVVIAAAFCINFLGRRRVISACVMGLILIGGCAELSSIAEKKRRAILAKIPPTARRWQISWETGILASPAQYPVRIVEYSPERIVMSMSYEGPRSRLHLLRQWVWDKQRDPFWGKWEQENDPPARGIWTMSKISDTEFVGQFASDSDPQRIKKNFRLVASGFW